MPFDTKIHPIKCRKAAIRKRELFDRAKKKTILSLYLALSLSFAPLYAKSATVDELNTQKADVQSKLDSLNKQIKQYQQQISSTESQANTLKNQITIFDDQIASLELQIQAKQTQIDDTNLQITEIKNLITEKNQEISDNKTVLGEMIKEMNESDNSYFLQTALGSNNLSDFLDQEQQTQNFQDKVYQVLQKIQSLKTELEKEQSNLQVQLTNLQQLQTQLQYTQNSLTTQRSQKQTLLYQTKGVEKNYQKLLASSKDDEVQLQQEADNLDAQIRAKLGNLKTPASKGMLAWPVDGVVTQGYGNTGFTSLGYTFHDGVDVAGPPDSPVYAAADGIIYDTDHSDQVYGNWVAIKHSIVTTTGVANIITLYGHMDKFIVSAGQTVHQGDIIGYEGNTGNTTKKLYGPSRGFHVHFGVYDVDGFGVKEGAYTKIYGPYKIPYGYTYNPLNFLQ